MSTSPRAAENNYTVFNISLIAQLKYLKIHLCIFYVLQELTQVLYLFCSLSPTTFPAVGRIHRCRNWVTLGTKGKGNWTLLSSWSVSTWWESKTSMKSEFILMQKLFFSNLNLIWVLWACWFVCFSDFICYQVPCLLCGPHGWPLLMLIHTSNTACNADWNVWCDWSIYSVLCQMVCWSKRKYLQAL